ncbi:uncharacterized protein LOC120336316 isoform X2 [Styela clava]
MTPTDKSKKSYMNIVKEWFTNSSKRKFLINIALFGAGVLLTGSFEDLTFESLPAPAVK